MAVLPELRRYHFAGDGRYCGDGGRELERLWRLTRWRALANCDGRFVCREKRLEPLSLAAVCRECGLNLASPVVQCRDEAEGIDAAECVRLCGGGGILTYIKPNGRRVHTLNTESGLCRKLLGMGATEELARTLHGEPGLLFRTLCCVLDAIPEHERTQSAPAVAVAFRFTVARSRCAQQGIRGEILMADTRA
jgi:hypothetical protein